MKILLQYKKEIFIGLAVLVLIVAVVVCSTKLRTYLKEKEEASAVEDEIKKSDVTLSKAQLYAYANKLYSAMEGWGTDEDQIHSVFGALMTTSDLYSLISTFGTKDGKTLPAWISDELNEKEINKINATLASKNIDYHF